MVRVDTGSSEWQLELHEGPMREVLNSERVTGVLGELAGPLKTAIAAHAQAVAGPRAQNYVDSLFVEETMAGQAGISFDGPFSLGDRPVVLIGVPPGDQSANPKHVPPLMIEAETHALTSQLGVTVGGGGEDVR